MPLSSGILRLWRFIPVVVVLAIASRASAQTVPADVETKVREDWGPFGRRLAFEGRVGMGTPVGAAGLMLEYGLFPQLSIAAGGGVGSGTKNIFHGAIAARVRPFVTPTAHNTTVLEAAFSTGGYQRFDAGELVPPADRPATSRPAQPSAAWAHFLQFEVAWEHRADNGFLLHLGGGMAMLLNPGALECPGSPTRQGCIGDSDRSPLVPVVVDLAVGQSF